MALPKQVQKQADELAVLEESLKPPQPSEPVVETPPENASDSSDLLNDAQATDTPAATPVAAPVEPQKPDVWEQRFRSLQGMFNTEVPRLQGEVQRLSGELAALREAGQQKPTSSKPNAKLVTQEDEEAFGSDLIALARKIAREEYGDRESGLLDKVRQLEEQLGKQVGEVRAETAADQEQRFYEKLTSLIPTWRTIQATSECQAWLGTRVPGSTLVWEDILLDAATKRDVNRAMEVFQTFLSAYPQHRPQQPSTAPKKPSPELSRQVAPAKSGAASPSATADKRVYTSAEYATVSMEVVRLRKAGRLDDAQRLENELNVALQENRVSP